MNVTHVGMKFCNVFLFLDFGLDKHTLKKVWYDVHYVRVLRYLTGTPH